MKISYALMVVVVAAIALGCSSGAKPTPTERPESTPTATQRPEPTPTATQRPSPTMAPATYLEATVEPCATVGADQRSPCGARPTPVVTPVGGVQIESEYVVLEQAPSLEEDMIDRSLNSMGWQYYHTPHFVVRGVFAPGTTLCDFTHRIDSNTLTLAIEDAGGPEFSRLSDYRAYVTCVTDLEAREYMVGKGPQTLAVVTKSNAGILAVADLYDLSYEDAYAKLQESGTLELVAQRFEGLEFIVWLAPPHNVAVRAWDMVHLWDVRGDGTQTRVVHHSIDHFKNTSENRAVLVYKLDDYREAVKAAHSKLMELHDGRIGSNDRLLPLLTDANEVFFEEHIKAEGAYDFADILTPYPLYPPTEK